MKTIKTLFLLSVSLLAFNLGFAQVNANFSSSVVYDSCWYQEVQFTDLSQNVPLGATYSWDFGDGSNSSAQHPLHAYSINGTQVFTVTLTISMNQNVIGTSTQQLTLSAVGPQIAYTYNGPSGCSFPQLYTFISNSGGTGGSIASWFWYVNGQNVGNGQTLSYTFSQPGVYLVDLQAYSTSGCSSWYSDSVYIGGNGLSVNATWQTLNSNCVGALVDLYSSVSGGAAPYTYQWNWYDFGSSTVANPQQVYLLNSVDPNVYLTVTDANGCTGSTVIQVPNNQNIFGSSNSSPSSSCGQSCDGTIDAYATGTAGPYNFVLGNDTLSGYQVVFSNLCPGTYDIEISDNSGCSTIITEVVYQDSLSSIIIEAVVNAGSNACASNNVCDNSIQVVASNGVAPYQYSIDFGVTYQSSNIFDSICTGIYVIDVIDSNGCVGSYSFGVQGTQALGIQSYEYYESCDSNSTGGGNGSFINVYAYGGAQPYTYLWSDGSTTSSLQNPSAGTYTVIVTDANGCTYSETFIVPSNQCYTISGNVYVDVNGNCIFDSTDYPASCFVDLTASAGGPWLWIYDYTDSNGAFSISAPAGTYYFDVNGYQVNNFTPLCPNASYSVTVGPNNPNAVVDFFLTPPPPTQDLSIATYPIYTPTPGFAYKTKVYYCNDGTIPMSGNVEVTYDANLIWMLSGNATANGWPINTTPAPSNHDAVNRVLTFDFTALAPGECRYITITYETDPTAGLMPNDPIYMEAVINPIPGDVTPANNVAYYVDYVTTSWDPNDKAVYPMGDITVDDNDHNYHIRFQNEGNANANTVVVRDELDANLALHSLRNIYASHDYILTVENNNELVFTFNNIQLVPKSVDEAASQGFVGFTISQDGDLPVGTTIANTAEIYFDFNPAIVTNTVENTIVEKTTGITNLEVQNALSVYPNPSSGSFYVNMKDGLEISNLRVYDLLGNIVLMTSDVQSTQALVNIQNSAAGVYFLEIETANGKAVQKLIKDNR